LNYLEGDRVSVVPHGIRTRKALPGAISETLKRSLSTGSPRIFYPAHPHNHKNHLNLVKAMELVRVKYPEARLYLTLGRHYGLAVHQKYVESVEAEIRKRNLGKNVVFLGSISRNEVQYCLKKVDMMVFPSMVETFGLPLIEALFCKCVTLASDTPYAREILGKCGRYFDPHSPESISEKIIEAVVQKKSIKSQINKTFPLLKRKYDLFLCTKRTTEIIDQVITSSPSG
jgi:glycosyltransferase involved in cell wall biosynthesis